MNLGVVTFIGFKGAGGYTIIIENDIFSFSYCHVSPCFLVSVGQYVYKGQIIASVGPKNVYNVLNNPYKDSNGNPTNRCNYWSTSSFCHKKRRPSRQSFRLFLNITCHLPRLHDVCIQNNFHYILLSLLFHLPSLVQLYYYILGLPLHLLIHHNLL